MFGECEHDNGRPCPSWEGGFEGVEGGREWCGRVDGREVPAAWAEGSDYYHAAAVGCDGAVNGEVGHTWGHDDNR